MTLVLVVGAAMLGIAVLLLVLRMVAGPTMLDRVVALDVLVAVTICVIGLEAAVNRHDNTLPILVSLTLLGFVGSVSVASFTKGSEDIEEDRS